MQESFIASQSFDVQPEVLFRAWLSSDEHSGFTGSEAKIAARIGGEFTAWDGYISGTTVEMDEPRRIVQKWRTTDFPEGAPDSTVELLFDPTDTGTRLTINHSGIPEGQARDYEKGWQEFYFAPMERYFADKSSSANA
jgi:activator of HSP90 ATPase